MNANDIVVAVLLNSPAVLAAVPRERIKIALLPDNIALPALVVKTISVLDDRPLKRGARRRQTVRVQVSVIARSYREQAATVAIVRTACDGATGTIADAERVAVLADGTGPDLLGDADTFEQAQDFKVSFETDV